MTTCSAIVFGTSRSFEDGGSIKSRSDCTYAQLEVVPPHELSQIFGLADLARSFFFAARLAARCSRQTRVGSSSGSGDC